MSEIRKLGNHNGFSDSQGNIILGSGNDAEFILSCQNGKSALLDPSSQEFSQLQSFGKLLPDVDQHDELSTPVSLGDLESPLQVICSDLALSPQR
jgi:hypothetical protein